MMNPIRQEVLRILAELSELAPEVRFGQMIVNLSYLTRGLSNESVWDMEDDECWRWRASISKSGRRGAE
jgi:hypothetical protein